MKKIRIERVSIGSIAVTILLGILLAFVSSECTQQFAALQTATDNILSAKTRQVSCRRHRIIWPSRCGCLW